MMSRRALLQNSAAAGLVARSAHAATNLVLVELFTSQGCSSCPPADDVLAKLSQRADVVALAFHVDYWDHLGWKDPFASPAFTRRQRSYRTAFGNRSVYTPQMVFNGTTEFPGQDERDAVRAVITAANRAEQRPAIALQHNGHGSVLVNINQGPIMATTSVFTAVYGVAKSTNVRRGENAGRRIANINIATSLEILGQYHGASTELTWTPNLAGAAGLAVWLQPNDLGPVLAVAQLRVSGAV
jgi:hypothetical protein